MNRYLTFGLRLIWFESFLYGLEGWLRENTLGPVQKKAMRNYLLDIKLIDPKGNLTPLAYEFSEIYPKDPKAVWQVVWLNLCLNSKLFIFYWVAVPFGSQWRKEELIKKLVELGYAERTARNAINALTNTFEESPLGEWFGKRVERGVYYKEGLRELSFYAFKKAYELFGENYEPYGYIFGIDREAFNYLLLKYNP